MRVTISGQIHACCIIYFSDSLKNKLKKELSCTEYIRHGVHNMYEKTVRLITNHETEIFSKIVEKFLFTIIMIQDNGSRLFFLIIGPKFEKYYSFSK